MDSGAWWLAKGWQVRDKLKMVIFWLRQHLVAFNEQRNQKEWGYGWGQNNEFNFGYTEFEIHI